MDKTYKGLLMIIAISLVCINIQLFVQTFVRPAHASPGVTKIVICNEYGSRCADVKSVYSKRSGHRNGLVIWNIGN